MSRSFLRLVKNCLTESIIAENPSFLITSPKSLEETAPEYEQYTKWSDFRVLIPILFNYFHGLELTLKGMCYLLEFNQHDPSARKISHKLSDWLSKFRTLYPQEENFASLIRESIYPCDKLYVLKNFYQANNLANSDIFYEILKYPYNKKFDVDYNYADLGPNGEGSIPFFERINETIDKIISESKSISSRYC